jgi:hypothetical protein
MADTHEPPPSSGGTIRPEANRKKINARNEPHFSLDITKDAAQSYASIIAKGRTPVLRTDKRWKHFELFREFSFYDQVHLRWQHSFQRL